ncbi:hypothetical protein [Pseudonocardia sp. NPDC049154]|uniref:hypothetical protein n=1 Tax=Pseudonocardia sp. NPDC049154 TaxID=3155501 RepID=UPI0033F7431F
MVRHPSGRFEFRGRGMHIIRRGGENLSTYALEIDLQSCPLVRDVAVTARADETLDAVVVVARADLPRQIGMGSEWKPRRK